MTWLWPMRAGIVVLCVTMVLALGDVAFVVVAHTSLAVRATLVALTSVCGLAGSGLVAMGSIRIIKRAEYLRLVARDRGHTAQNAK
jgi:hypothetical protein